MTSERECQILKLLHDLGLCGDFDAESSVWTVYTVGDCSYLKGVPDKLIYQGVCINAFIKRYKKEVIF